MIGFKYFLITGGSQLEKCISLLFSFSVGLKLFSQPIIIKHTEMMQMKKEVDIDIHRGINGSDFNTCSRKSSQNNGQ